MEQKLKVNYVFKIIAIIHNGSFNVSRYPADSLHIYRSICWIKDILLANNSAEKRLTALNHSVNDNCITYSVMPCEICVIVYSTIIGRTNVLWIVIVHSKSHFKS